MHVSSQIKAPINPSKPHRFITLEEKGNHNNNNNKSPCHHPRKEKRKQVKQKRGEQQARLPCRHGAPESNALFDEYGGHMNEFFAMMGAEKNNPNRAFDKVADRFQHSHTNLIVKRGSRDI